MRIKFWGTRGTRPTPGRRTLRYGGNTTCLEVRDKENNLIIVDSGSGIAELGAGLSQSEPLQAHVLITHTHLDHIQGFPFFMPAFVPGTHLTIVGPAGSAKSRRSELITKRLSVSNRRLEYHRSGERTGLVDSCPIPRTRRAIQIHSSRTVVR